MKTRKMIFCSLFAALTAAASQIVVPLPFTPVPVNLATFVVSLAGAVLGPATGAVSQLVYLAVGAAGLPVFTKMQGGLSVLFGPTGGYLVGYVVCAWLVGFLCVRSADRFWKVCAAMAAGCAACYAFGTAWYMLLTWRALADALLLCVVPFLPGDVLKIVLAAVLSLRLKPFLERPAASRISF